MPEVLTTSERFQRKVVPNVIIFSCLKLNVSSANNCYVTLQPYYLTIKNRYFPTMFLIGSCDFGFDLCGWSNAVDDDLDWVQWRGNNGEGGPIGDRGKLGNCQKIATYLCQYFGTKNVECFLNFLL